MPPKTAGIRSKEGSASVIVTLPPSSRTLGARLPVGSWHVPATQSSPSPGLALNRQAPRAIRRCGSSAAGEATFIGMSTIQILLLLLASCQLCYKLPLLRDSTLFGQFLLAILTL